MNENVEIKGKLKIEQYRNGDVIQVREVDNVITNAGKNLLATKLVDGTVGTGVVTHMGFGIGTGTVDKTDTTLFTEITGNNYARQAVTRSNSSSNVVRYMATLSGLTAQVTVTEAGLFSNVTGATMFAKQLTGTFTLAVGDTLQITWDVTFTY